jgi:hypothetical protein
VSQLKQFRRCGEAYRLERMSKDRKWVPAAWTIKGIAFHSAYDYWEGNGRPAGIRLGQLFAEHYDQEVEEAKEQQPDLDQWRKTPNVQTTQRDIDLRRRDGIVQADVYQKHCEIALWRPIKIEWAFKIRFGTVEVWGAIDALLRWPDGSVTVRDIKTGNREQDYTQLGVYKVVAQEQLNHDIRWGEFWYTKDGANHEVKLERYTRPYLTDQFESLDLAINTKIFLANPGKQCDMCDVRPDCREMGWNK